MRHQVEQWLDSCERVKSSTTRGDYITLIKGVMKWAKVLGYVERNPIEDMPKPLPYYSQIPPSFAKER